MTTPPRDAFERELTTDLKDRTPDRPRGWPLHTRILVGLAVGVVAGLAVNALWGGDAPGGRPASSTTSPSRSARCSSAAC